jgi:hypothetical protein
MYVTQRSEQKKKTHAGRCMHRVSSSYASQLVTVNVYLVALARLQELNLSIARDLREALLGSLYVLQQLLTRALRDIWVRCRLWDGLFYFVLGLILARRLLLLFEELNGILCRSWWGVCDLVDLTSGQNVTDTGTTRLDEDSGRALELQEELVSWFLSECISYLKRNSSKRPTLSPQIVLRAHVRRLW